ncbi:MAG: ribonuclease P protein component [Patescibacteria group bacterium]
MFARPSRLSKDEILSLSRAGKSLSTNIFSLKVAPAKVSKFAFIASKKECGGSVDRSRAKRRARAAMMKVAPSLKSPIFCIMYIKKGLIEADFKDIHTKLQNLLQ